MRDYVGGVFPVVLQKPTGGVGTIGMFEAHPCGFVLVVLFSLDKNTENKIEM